MIQPTETNSLLLPDHVRQRLLVRFVLHSATRYVFAWLLALGLGVGYLNWAWHYFNEAKRRDGNVGHVWIDFGGQWLLGRMIVEGHGRNLYLRPLQRELLLRHYPRDDEIPAEERDPTKRNEHDAEDLLGSFQGREDRPVFGALILPLAGANAIEGAGLLAIQREYALRPRSGPLYPPIHALLFSGVSLLSPQTAYRLMQVANIVFAFVAGLGISRLLRGRVWWPVAATAVILYPGFPGTVCLGQNAPITLSILVWGWVLVARGRPGWGGAVWGLLAFKPVWGMAFFLVPLLTGRWRMCGCMLAGGAALAGLTLPVVGWESWLDWLHVGRAANRTYDTDLHWIFLSRDLLSIPRRWLIDFSDLSNADRLAPAVLGWALLVGVLEITIRFVVLRRNEAHAITGPLPAFLFLGAWCVCLHFMYYDVLLTALPVALLFAEPGDYLRPVFLVTTAPDRLPPDPRQTLLGPRWQCLVSNVVLTLLGLMLLVEYAFPHLGLEVFVWANPLAPLHDVLPLPLEFTTNLMGTPWHTFLLLSLWLWCAWLAAARAHCTRV